MDPHYLQLVQEPDQKVNPLFNLLEIRIIRIHADECILELPLKEEFTQGAGITAGGILATLADEAMAHVVLANLEQGFNISTIEMNIRYFRPVKNGTLTATSTIMKGGKRVMYPEVEIKDSNGVTIARAGGSFIVKPARVSR